MDRASPPTAGLSRRRMLGTALGAALGTGLVAGLGTTPAVAGAGPDAPRIRDGGTVDRPLVRPPRLQPGMRVGLVAPASTVAEDDDIDAAADRIRSLGFEVRRAPNLDRRTAYLAGTDSERAEGVNGLLRDPEVDAIFCLRGGYGTARILPLIDYAALAAQPRVVLGYSDITALHLAIHARTGVVGFHGPIAAANFTDYAWDQFQRVLMTPSAPLRIGAPPPFETAPGRIDVDNRLVRIAPGVAEGPLLGGNLSLVASLMGTPFEPDLDGALLFLEDVDEAPYAIDRMLTQLWLAGKLQRCAGIVFGKFTDADYDGNTFSVETVLRDRCADLGIPVLAGVMIGHIDDQTVVPVGVRARLDVDAGSLTLLETGVA